MSCLYCTAEDKNTSNKWSRRTGQMKTNKFTMCTIYLCIIYQIPLETSSSSNDPVSTVFSYFCIIWSWAAATTTAKTALHFVVVVFSYFSKTKQQKKNLRPKNNKTNQTIPNSKVELIFGWVVGWLLSKRLCYHFDNQPNCMLMDIIYMSKYCVYVLLYRDPARRHSLQIP